MMIYRGVLVALLSMVLFLFAGGVHAQQSDRLFQGFSSSGLTSTEKRYLQAALAFEGHYIGLLDGDWGKLSQSAMRSYSLKEFGAEPEEWHTAALALDFFNNYAENGWEMQYFPALGLSLLLPAERLITDAPSGHLLNYRHDSSSLAISVGRHTQAVASNLHQFTVRAHAVPEEAYSVRKTNFAVSTATMSDGTKLYTRSNFIDGAWSTVMLSAKLRDTAVLQAVSSSIMVGESPPLDIARGGKLIRVVQEAVAVLEAEEEVAVQERAGPPPLSAGSIQERDTKKGASSTGTGFVVSPQGHILTNAHVVQGCREIVVDGVPAVLLDSSSDFDLALLKADELNAKAVAVFSASPAALNSDVTAVGYPYAGLLGGLNVTRGSISSLKGLVGDSTTFQITAPVQSGNSGGPLLAADGEVVGVIVSKLDATLVAEKIGDVPQNVNFAVRGEIAKLFLAQNQVSAKLSLDDTAIEPEQLAQNAAKFTYLIECR